MKFIFTFLLLVVAKLAAGQPRSHYPDKPSTHGMMLMGSKTIYASHLPMFHSPHDYQIILELELSKADLLKYMADRNEHPQENVYTLEPEHFVLPEMVNHIKVFKGNIYRGHFERGGTPFIKDATVKIKTIIYFNQFKKETIKSEKLRYILFGNPREQFLVHQIQQKPDFDENLAVHISDHKILKKLKDKPFLLIEFPEADLRKPFSWKENSGIILDTMQPAIFQHYQLLYLEYGDLN